MSAPAAAPADEALATWGARAGAMVIDCVLVGVLSSLVVVGDHGVPDGGRLPSSVSWISTGLALVYFTVLNGTGSGQTLGNRATGIAVRDLASGRTVGLGRSLLRFAVRAVLYLLLLVPGLVNDLSPLWDPARRSLADKAAGTLVVKVR